MAKKFSVPRGTYDILPEESRKWNYIKNKFKKICSQYGFGEIVTPVFEQANLFERSSGDTSDVVQKEMYKFEDKKGRLFALRPEGTAPVIRSYVENNLGFSGNVVKLAYTGPMFRYDRPQKGRYRQFYQFGIEAIGSDHPYIDAEIIAFGYHFLTELGLKNFTVEINSLGCPDCMEDYNKALRDFIRPNLDKMCPDCQKRFDKNPKRLLDCKSETCKTYVKNSPSVLDYLDEDCKEKFEKVKEYLAAMEIPFAVNPGIVRGLDYYTNTAFEFINNNLGAQSAVLAGGRYNGLVGMIGGKETPGIGFAGGFERLILSMEQENLSFGEEEKPDAYFVNLGEKAELAAYKIVADLRKAGLTVKFDIDKNSVKSQMKAADKSGANFCLILGEDELENDKIMIKNLETGNQELYLIKEIPEIIKKRG
ncbi:MAG: histidine--tRNA ligase [Candidatus Cloacimonadota bacterium]|nr:MAG: histidine--tRNA ligase [Candidatus Cloacimonadota bacterium]